MLFTSKESAQNRHVSLAFVIGLFCVCFLLSLCGPVIPIFRGLRKSIFCGFGRKSARIGVVHREIVLYHILDKALLADVFLQIFRRH